MATITIQVNDNKALKLIQDLADLKVIRIVKEVATSKKEKKESDSVPLWQKKILDQRIATLEEDKKNALDFDDAIHSISTELGL